MANYTAWFRSNYFAVKDAAHFKQYCDAFRLTMITQVEANQTLYGFLNEEHEGGIPITRYNAAIDDWEEVDMFAALATHLVADHVAIVIEVGFEKLRYLVGKAYAVNATGKMIEVNIDEIYARAAALGQYRTSCTY